MGINVHLSEHIYVHTKTLYPISTVSVWRNAATHYTLNKNYTHLVV